MLDSQILVNLVHTGFAVSILACVYRLIQGPSNMTRVVSLEFVSALCIAYAIWHTWLYKEPLYFDIAIAVGSIGYIGTVTYSKWLSIKEAT